MDKRMITIGGESYPIRVTMGAMLRYKRLTGNEASELSTAAPEDLLAFIFCCIASACAADGVTFALTFEAFADKLSVEDMNKMSEMLSEDSSQDAGEESKKKERLTA